METVPLYGGHLDGVAALEAEIFRERDPWPRSAFEGEIANPDGLWYVAEEAGKLAGYGGGWCVTPEFHLLNLAVDPALRRRGIASAIVTAVLGKARERGCGEAFLEVRKGNTEAEALYTKMGFIQVSRRPKYYSGGEDAVVMKLTLG